LNQRSHSSRNSWSSKIKSPLTAREKTAGQNRTSTTTNAKKQTLEQPGNERVPDTAADVEEEEQIAEEEEEKCGLHAFEVKGKEKAETTILIFLLFEKVS
jgi:hypothetical protein